MTTPRYRRSSVRAVLETVAQDHAVAAQAHDPLWAVLWNRRFDDVDEPIWAPESVFSGVLAFVRPLDDDVVLTGVDTGANFVVFRGAGAPPPIGSRVRMVPSVREQWRFADVVPLGLKVELRFDEQTPIGDRAWIGTLRDGVGRLRTLLEPKREQLAARRAKLGALSEPQAVEEIWREEIAAVNDRVALQTEYTPAERAALAKAHAKGARHFDEEQARVVAARKRRFSELANSEVARFRAEAWPEIRDRALAETRKYADYRTEVVRLEDALQRIRMLTDRATKGTRMLDLLERASVRVCGLDFALERLEDPAYADELLRTIELLHAAIPARAQAATTPFSAYRPPTAVPSVPPPRS